MEVASYRFHRSFSLIFGQEKYEFLYITVGTYFDEKSSNQFYVCIIVVGILYTEFFKILFSPL